MSLSGINRDSIYGRRGSHLGSTESFTRAHSGPSKKHDGPLTRAAKSSGMSLKAYADAHKSDKGIEGKRSRFYLNVIYPRKKK